MATIFDLVTARAIATYWNDRLNTTANYIGRSLFPVDKQLGLDLAWFVGSSGVPVTLKASAFDTEARTRDRIGISRVDTTMPFFREQMFIGEKERQEMNKMRQADQAMVAPILQRIYDDAGQLVKGGEAMAERMRMQLLSTGLISVVDSGARFDYDYSFPAGHKTTISVAADKWSATTTANPVRDITNWQDQVEADTGVRPTRAICTKKTFNYLVNNDAIRKDMQPLVASSAIVTPSDVVRYFANKLNLTIAINSLSYRTSTDGVTAKFFPDEVFTLIPEGNLGKTWFGTTPEESDLMSGSEAQVQIVNTGIAITTVKQVHPVNIQTIVSAIMLPSWENRDQVFIATVHS
jgi:hypothetical protein